MKYKSSIIRKEYVCIDTAAAATTERSFNIALFTFSYTKLPYCRGLCVSYDMAFELKNATALGIICSGMFNACGLGTLSLHLKRTF